MKNVTFLFLFIFGVQYSFCQNTKLFFNPSHGDLYYGIKNQVYVNCKKCDNIRLLADGYIELIDSCLYNFTPNNIGWTDLIIQDNKQAQSDTFRVYIKPIDDFEAKLNQRKAEFPARFDSLIVKSQILEELNIGFKIKEFKVITYSIDTVELINEGGKFQNNVLDRIQKLKINDIVEIYNIVVIVNDKEFYVTNNIKYRIK